MKKAIRYVELAYNTVLVLMTAVIILLGIYQVVGRQISFMDTSWTEEAMRYIYVGIIMLGLACVTKDESFTTITVISDAVGSRSKAGGMLLYLFKNLAQIVCFALLFWYGLKLDLSAGNRVAATTRVPFNIIYAPIPIGSFLALVFSVLKMVEKLLPKQPDSEVESHE